MGKQEEMPARVVVYFSYVEKFSDSSKIHKLSMFFPCSPSCEVRKEFRAEPTRYGLEINFKARESDVFKITVGLAQK